MGKDIREMPFASNIAVSKSKKIIILSTYRISILPMATPMPWGVQKSLGMKEWI
jgi:hypothetical protein